MKQVKTWILGGLLAVMLTATASANNYEQGKEAYDAGDYETALAILKPLAEAGNSDAQLTLSWMYYFGRGVIQDDEEWVKWRNRAFNIEDDSTPTATGTLGTIEASKNDFHEGVQAYADGDYATAYAKIFPAAELQNADALYFLGLMYYNGHGVEQDYEQAAYVLYRAADGGSIDAQNLLGVMYDHGKGVAQNVEEAVKWFRLAASAGHAEAQLNLEKVLASIEAAAPADDLQKGLAAYHAGDYATAIANFAPLAEAGHADAQISLGYMYHEGKGVTQNYAEAVKWVSLAAEQGLADAQNWLGKMYQYGEVIEQNDEEAIKWYRFAAEQGHADAQQNLEAMLASAESAAGDTPSAADLQKGIDAYGAGDYATAIANFAPLAEAGHANAQNNLGVMYHEGKGVTQNYAEAVKWISLAAEQGLADAQNWLGYMYDKGNGVAQDYAEAVKWYRRAAKQGYAPAQNNLGYMYYNGYGVAQNSAEAVKWYRLAIEQGHTTAQDNLRWLCAYDGESC